MFWKILIVLSLLAAVCLAADSVWVAAEKPPADTTDHNVYWTCPICGKCLPENLDIHCPEHFTFDGQRLDPCLDSCWLDFACRNNPDSLFTKRATQCDIIHWGYWEITVVDTIGLEP